MAKAALNWQVENAIAQNQVLSKIMDNQQKMAEVVTHTFSSSNSFVEDLKKKIKMVERKVATIASTVKDLSVSFLILDKRKRKENSYHPYLQQLSTRGQPLLTPLETHGVLNVNYFCKILPINRSLVSL